MTAQHDDLARKMAARLSRTWDPKLPTLVEAMLAEGEDDEAPRRSFKPDLGLKIAGFVVSVASAAWDIAKDVRTAEDKKKQADPAAALEPLEQRVAYLEGLVRSRLRIEVDLPAQVPTRVRDETFQAAAEEVALDIAAEEDQRRPSGG